MSAGKASPEEILGGLQLLLKAPSKGVVEKIFTVSFDRRTTGLTDSEESQIGGALGGAELEDVRRLLAAVRLVIRVSLRKGVSLDQIRDQLPQSVDARLREMVIKIISAHLQGWQDELAGAAPAAPAPVPVPPPQEVPQPPPPPAVVAPVAPPAPPPAAPVVEEKEEEEEERTAAAPVQEERVGGPSLPRLKGFDWRVDVKRASDSVSHMSIPTLLVQLRVENQHNGEKVVPGAKGDDQRVVTFELNKETLSTMLDGLLFVKEQLSAIAK